jgi:hypothetical protein
MALLYRTDYICHRFIEGSAMQAGVQRRMHARVAIDPETELDELNLDHELDYYARFWLHYDAIRLLMDGRQLLLLASLFLAFDRFSVGLWADLEAMFAPTGLFSPGFDWSPFTSYPAMVREIKDNQSQSTVITSLPFGINPFYALLHGLHLPAAMVCMPASPRLPNCMRRVSQPAC